MRQSLFVIICVTLILGGCAASEQERDSDARAAAQALDNLADHERIVQIAAGGDHACARAESGHVYCWGKNSIGQVGDGSTDNRLRPVMVEGISDAVDITAGGGHTCAVHEDSTVSCWGLDSHGQLGRGRQRHRGDEFDAQPAKVARVGAMTDKRLSADSRYGGGKVMCRAGGQLDDIVQVEAGVRHTCALHASGAVLCWGENRHGGALGTMWERDGVHCPMPVWNVEKARELGAASSTTCAVLEGGKVRCWGSSSFSMMSDFSGEDAPNPYSRMVEMRGLDDARAVSIGAKHICAVREGGELACWGSNHEQSLRPSSEQKIVDPLTIEELDGVVDVDTAGAQQCAVRKDGSVWCWGGDKGLIQPESGPQQTAVRVGGLDGVEQVRLGGYSHLSESGYSIGVQGGYGCALDGRGRVQCWGNNGSHLGDGSREGRSEPKPVDFGDAFAAAANAESEEEPEDEPTDELARADEREDAESCAVEKTVGDPSLPNSLTLQFGDMRRTFYFERAVAEVQNQNLVVSFPRIELKHEGQDQPSRKWSPRIAIALTKGSPAEQTQQPRRAHTFGGPGFEGWDCMKFLPRQYGTSTLQRYLPPDSGHGDGLAEGEFSLYAGSPELGAINGTFRIRDFVRAPRSEGAASADNSFLHDDEMHDASELQVVYKPSASQLSIEMNADRPNDKSRRRRRPLEKTFFLNDFDGEPGTYENRNRTFVIEEFVAGVARGKIYEMRRVDGASDRGFDLQPPGASDSKEGMPAFFDRARKKQTQAKREKVLVASFATDRVFERPQLGAVAQLLPPEEDEQHRRDRSRGRDDEPDLAFELSPKQPARLAEVSEPVRVVLEGRRSTRNEADRWSEPADKIIGWQAGTFDTDEGPKTWFSFYSLNPHGLDDDITIELEDGTLLPRSLKLQLNAKYSVERLSEVDAQIEAEAGERGEIRAPITVNVEFGDGEVQLVAENQIQGRDSYTLEVPEPTFHESQLFAVLEYLPLEPGYTSEFSILSIRKRSHRNSGTDVVPGIDRVEVSVVGEKSLSIGPDAEAVDAWMVRVKNRTVYVSKDGHVLGFDVRGFGSSGARLERMLRATPPQ